MWRLGCPDFDKATGDDLDELVTLGVITRGERGHLETLVENYHNQQGHITQAQQNTLASAIRDRLHEGYEKKKLMYKGNKLEPIAADLYLNVGACPYCGVGLSETLDHFMHKNKWKSLSLCRLNLVPCCWKCNGFKSTKDSQLFVHPYYASLPQGIFLRARCEINGTGYLFRFDFDPTVVTDATLLGRLRTQWNELQLDIRLKPAVTQFICSSVAKSPNVDTLRTLLPIILEEKEAEYGENHWRSAILRSCISEVNNTRRDAFFTAITHPDNRSRDMRI